MWKRVLLGLLAAVLILVGLFITFAGPWPTYDLARVEDLPAYGKALAAVDKQLAAVDADAAPGRLLAGWASADIVPPIGTPLAGYGEREGKPSISMHDPLHVKALALANGAGEAVLVASDMLIVPENVAEAVRARLAAEGPVDPHVVLFSATHTHSGPGAWAPGLLGEAFSGEYDPEIVAFLTDRFYEAIAQAQESRGRARVAWGGVDVPRLIRNRTREAVTDPELSCLIVEKENGSRCYVASYSAHATVLGGDNMEFSGDYPGAFQRSVEKETGGFCMFLAGAVGSMSPRTLNGRTSSYSDADEMGAYLAERLLEDAQGAEFEETPRIASVGIGFDLPPLQLRLTPNWRVSPFFLNYAGVDNDGWAQGVRVGDVFIYGAPADMSGEISVEWKRWAGENGIDLWVTSFAGDYAGYVSPDAYYQTAKNDDTEGYEMYLMSWTGPKQEAFFAGIMERMASGLWPERFEASQAVAPGPSPGR